MDSNRNSSLTRMPKAADLGLQLRIAAERGIVQECKRLLATGATVTKDANGLTAVHKAAKCGHTGVLKTLLARRCFNINTQDKYGWTALHWAAWNGHSTAIACLAGQSGCIINVSDKTGSNPIHCAALNGHTGTIRILASMKCDVDQQRKDGWTPLHLATWNGHQDAVHQLITSKAKVNLTTDDNKGAVHLAAAKGYSEIVQELLDAGAAPDMIDMNGNTSLHEAVRWHHTHTAQVLLQSNCRINTRNAQGETPIDIAKSCNFDDIIALLSGATNHNGLGMCRCTEYRRILSQNGEVCPEELRKLGICQEGKKRTRKTSELDVLEAGLRWEDRLAVVKAELVARYESRIADMEVQCHEKVAKIERACGARLQAARQLLREFSDGELDKAPSAPSLYRSSLPSASSFPAYLRKHSL